MTNSWSLLYEEMYGPEDEGDYIDWKKVYEGNHPDYELTADGFVWPKVNDLPQTDQSTYIDEYPGSINLNIPKSTMSEDRIDLNLDQLATNGFWK